MEKIVFTNGCFDIIHPGHVDLLRRARSLGTKLIVGINSDSSVRSIKGVGRPYFNEDERKVILLAMRSVDEVRVFSELTPERLIRELKPSVLVKGGDWKVEEIVGAEFVIETGGEVHSLPLIEGYSTSRVIEGMSTNDTVPEQVSNDIVVRSLDEHREVFERVIGDCVPAIKKCFQIILETLENGGKILICGNGGSAADAQHIAAEFVGRYESERIALPAIALTTDTSALTALANDYGFERIFARQVEALGRKGDCLIAISTSGNSPNVISAVMTARGLGCKVIGMTGAKGKKLASLSDACILVPSERTARIQEMHITTAHIWCELVDDHIGKKSNAQANN